MYEAIVPKVDELVMVQIVRVDPECVFVKLLAYEGREGMIQLSELSRRRIRSIHQIAQVRGGTCAARSQALSPCPPFTPQVMLSAARAALTSQ
jgi:hypothetical protein